jgi:acyl carrier protein
MAMTEADVLAVVRRVALEELAFKREIDLGDDLIGDLELDSLALITLAVAVEDHFAIALPEEESVRVRTVGDLCRLVLRQVGAA